MKIAEIYRSVQGEGLLTGTACVFVRVSGCNLRCWFCDTPYASWAPEGRDLAVDDVAAHVQEWDCRHAVITGGEPMLFSELIPLCQRLSEAGKHITIETAGTLYLPVGCHLMSISPKLLGSAPPVDEHPHWSRRHERTRQRLPVVRRLMAEHNHQLKFVVDHPCELPRVERYVDELGGVDPERVLIMPQGVTADELSGRAEWVRPFCERRGYTYCPRKQIEWFGGARGT